MRPLTESMQPLENPIFGAGFDSNTIEMGVSDQVLLCNARMNLSGTVMYYQWNGQWLTLPLPDRASAIEDSPAESSSSVAADGESLITPFHSPGMGSTPSMATVDPRVLSTPLHDAIFDLDEFNQPRGSVPFNMVTDGYDLNFFQQFTVSMPPQQTVTPESTTTVYFPLIDHEPTTSPIDPFLPAQPQTTLVCPLGINYMPQDDIAHEVGINYTHQNYATHEVGVESMQQDDAVNEEGYKSPSLVIEEFYRDQALASSTENSDSVTDFAPQTVESLAMPEGSLIPYGHHQGELPTVGAPTDSATVMSLARIARSGQSSNRGPPRRSSRFHMRAVRSVEHDIPESADVDWRNVIPRDGMLGPDVFDPNFDDDELRQEEVIRRAKEITVLTANIKQTVLENMPVLQYSAFDVTTPPREFRPPSVNDGTRASDGPRINNNVAEQRVLRTRARNNAAAKKCRIRKDQLVERLHEELSAAFIEGKFWKVQAMNRGVRGDKWDQVDPEVKKAMMPTKEEIENLQQKSRTNQLSRAAIRRSEETRLEMFH